LGESLAISSRRKYSRAELKEAYNGWASIKSSDYNDEWSFIGARQSAWAAYVDVRDNLDRGETKRRDIIKRSPLKNFIIGGH
jgi:hypothetical protein